MDTVKVRDAALPNRIAVVERKREVFMMEIGRVGDRAFMPPGQPW